MANAESEINYYNSKQVIGNSLERMNQIEDLANKSVKFLPYCWDNRKDLNGCFRVSSMMFVAYDQNNNNLAYLHLIEGQSEDSGLIYRLKIQNLSTNKIILDKKFYYEVDSKEYENKDLKLYQPISYKLINLKVIHDREECIAYLRNAIEE